MVKIRLRRMGAKKHPFYRVVVADAQSPRDGRYIEELGYYDPTKNPAVVHIDVEKAMRWLSNGAQPTDTARSLLRQAGVLKRMHEMRQAARGGEEAGA
ncbi:ribosomal protein S16 (BS17) [Candidatus Hydrogenisulfobacillus filiaventi]|uniref:Small ribosomal subunit protein bS16 n=1 Tax=Candidatus Hydrogenisulfobacillus filiaventi TaxID=2707344 RepID=A0A6F8ZH20_9FIRM|nr:30S ribosomal protein S16 [Bacillota bacterium]CAB1129086.1 ribosomal protein S16 (BS17) [Candidatus Hydrogenisulfobacillus filiaventi]